MLTPVILTADKSVERAASYYEDGVDDYYQKEGESKVWQGVGAEMLGLTGDVGKAEFKGLLAGRLPDGEVFRSSIRNDSKTRIGIDFTFHAPKSVSMQALVSGDAGIIKAHDLAVTAAVAELEKRTQAREKINGKSYTQITGNLIVAKFRHETNREQEPHLHTHAVAINATRRADGAWRALVNDELIKNPKLYGTIYKTILAAELEKQGYKLRFEKDSFELAHISREQILGMSTRTQQINDALEAQGLTRESSTPEQRNYIAKATRKAKDKNVDGEMLRERWKNISNDLGVDFNSREWEYNDKASEKAAKHIVENLETLTKEQAAKRAVQFAINHYTERQTIVDREYIFNTALEHALGKTTNEEINNEIERLVKTGKLVTEAPIYQTQNSGEKKAHSKEEWVGIMVAAGKSPKEAKRQVNLAITHGRLVKLNERFTTQKAMDQERRILSAELNGRGKAEPIMLAENVGEYLETTTLRKDQKEAAHLVLTSTNKILGIQGKAGVGKSYMTKQVTDKIKESGYFVHVLAPYGTQKKALRNDGMDEARTVASFLHTLSREHQLNEKTVIVVDEAGVLPNRLLDRLTQISESTGARLVLIGDTEQTKAVEAGIPFAILQRNGMETALMNENQRQKDNPQLLKAVELAAAGKSAESLSYITQVNEIENPTKRFSAIANAYVSLPEKERNDTLVLTGTNESRVKLNNLIRKGLGMKSEVEVTALTRIDTTKATRRYSRYYQAYGTAIRPERDYLKSGLERGKVYIVTDHGQGNTLIVKDEDGQSFTINPAQHTQLSVYKLEKQAYGVGENLVITRNDAGMDIANGDKFTITAINGKHIYLTDGQKEIVFDTTQKLHLDYNYVKTVHSAQGLTATNVLANIEAKSRTVDKDWYYVAMSRAKMAVTVFTENRKKLPSAISKLSEKTAALDHGNKSAQKINERNKAKEAGKTPEKA